MINQYENILTIFERLADVSDKMVDENDPDAKGFIKCLYTLQYALKKFEGINFHLENKRLENALYLAKLRIKEFKEDENRTFLRNAELTKENVLLRSEVKKLQQPAIKITADLKGAEFKKVAIDWKGEDIFFWINTTEEYFMKHFEIATDWVLSKKSTKHISAVKCQYLTYYRALGYTCLTNY